MGTSSRTNCCNARVFTEKNKTYCFKCKQEVKKNDLHDITTRGTARLELNKK